MEYSVKSASRHELLERWALNAKRSQISNYRAASHYSKCHKLIGVPVVVLAGIVGTSLFASLEAEVDPWIQIGLGFVSVLAAVLAGLQTFLDYGNRASKHKLVAAEYGSVKRTIQELLTRESIEEKEVSAIRERMNMLGREGLELPQRFHDFAHEKLPEPHLQNAVTKHS